MVSGLNINILINNWSCRVINWPDIDVYVDIIFKEDLFPSRLSWSIKTVNVIYGRLSFTCPGIFIKDIYIFLALAGICIFIFDIFRGCAVIRFRVIKYIYVVNKLASIIACFMCVLSLANDFNSDGSICDSKTIKFKSSRKRNLYKISEGLNRIILRFVELLIANWMRVNSRIQLRSF